MKEESENQSETDESSFSGRLPDFDCNICLSFAADPIITLCGHLFCWPCIYRHLHLNSTNTFSSNCPVCKSPFSESTLIPLYGRGNSPKRSEGIPARPTEHRKLVATSERRIYPVRDYAGGGIMQSNAGAVLGLYGWEGGRRRSLREMREESWLGQLWCFLCCCGLLCLLFF